jgi:hypothetical protein
MDWRRTRDERKKELEERMGRENAGRRGALGTHRLLGVCVCVCVRVCGVGEARK